MTFEEKEYIAGLIDADGNIDVSLRQRRDGLALFPKVSVSGQDLEVLEALQQGTPRSCLYKSGSCFILEWNSRNAFELLEAIGTSLRLKRHKARVLSGHTIDERVSAEEFRQLRADFDELVLGNDLPSLPWLAGFVDGDGAIMAEKQHNKLRGRLAITYDHKYEAFMEKVRDRFGGFLRDSSDNRQWCLNLTPDELQFLSDLIPLLRMKRYQALMLFYYVSRYPKHTRADPEHSHEVWRQLQKMKFSTLDFDDYEVLAGCTAVFPEKQWIQYLALGLASEAGEVLGKVKKLLRGDYDPDEVFYEHLKNEVSDVMWYVSQLCHRLPGCSYRSVHKDNLDKLFDRFLRGALKGEGDER